MNEAMKSTLQAIVKHHIDPVWDDRTGYDDESDPTEEEKNRHPNVWIPRYLLDSVQAILEKDLSNGRT